MEDSACLQRNLDRVNQWCDLWQMDLNQSKGGLLLLPEMPARISQLPDVQVKEMEAKKDLGF